MVNASAWRRSLLALPFLLAACQSLDFDSVFGASPEPVAPPPAPPPPPSPQQMMAAMALPTAQLWTGERILQRFATLHRLAMADLIDRKDFEAWAQRNRGALLLLTAPPAEAGLDGRIPSYDELAAFLVKLGQERPDIAAVERTALLEQLMPANNPAAAASRPPLLGDQLARWQALLDQAASQGLLSAAAVEREKSAIAVAVSLLPTG